MAAVLIKTLSLSFGGANVECQLNTAEIVDTPTTEETVTFCGTDTVPTPNYALNIGGFQDYGALGAVCDMLHDAYRAFVDALAVGGDPTAGQIDFVLTVGTRTRSGRARPAADVPFGGAAGSALTFTTTLDVTDGPHDGEVVTP